MLPTKIHQTIAVECANLARTQTISFQLNLAGQPELSEQALPQKGEFPHRYPGPPYHKLRRQTDVKS